MSVRSYLMTPARSEVPAAAASLRAWRHRWRRRRLVLGMHGSAASSPSPCCGSARDIGEPRRLPARTPESTSPCPTSIAMRRPRAIAGLARLICSVMAAEVEMETAAIPSRMTTRPLPLRLTCGEKTQHCNVILSKFSHHPVRAHRNPAQSRGEGDCTCSGMVTLIADRFVCNRPRESCSVAQGFSLAALDLATGYRGDCGLLRQKTVPTSRCGSIRVRAPTEPDARRFRSHRPRP